MKIKNTFFKFLLSFFLCITLIQPSLASALDNEDSFNEYDLIVQKINSAKKFKTTNNSELTKAQNELKDLKEHIYSLKTKSLFELRAANCTDEQIYAIQNYDGSDAMTRAASAVISRTKAQFRKKKYNSSTKRTEALVYTTYTMNGVPSFNLPATIVIGIHDGGNWFDSGKGNMVVKYRSYYNNSYHYLEYNHTGKAASNSTGARSFDFDLHKTSNGYAYYANTISVNFEASRQGKIQVATCVNSFSRITSSIGSVGFSVSVSGLSFSISGGLTNSTTKFSAFQSYPTWPYNS